ncbi:MAG: hypothetical protein ACLTZT_03700 [Butyricimonas faecalis]
MNYAVFVLMAMSRILPFFLRNNEKMELRRVYTGTDCNILTPKERYSASQLI